MTSEQKHSLLQLARDAIQAQFSKAPYQTPSDPFFREKRGLFVTLHLDGRLRGCIGYIQPYKNITESIVEMAKAAAFRDPRFNRVTAEELPNIEIEISVLGELTIISDVAEIEIGRDGLYLEHPHGSGLLLPQVATEWDWDRETLLQQLCMKAGVHNRAWLDESAVLYRFSAEIFGE